MFRIAAVILAVAIVPVHAAVTPQEAEKLKTTLTPLGGERAGNADGSIPAWNGGNTTVAPGWKQGEPRPDPFADEKMVLSITAKDVDKYKDKLSEGAIATFKKYPDWRIDVYPTHRTASAPQYVYDNTFINATSASLGSDGLSLNGAYGGAPFPIPKSGAEAIWNRLTVWHGEAVAMKNLSVIGTADGKLVTATETDMTFQYPYYNHEGRVKAYAGDLVWLIQANVGPPYKAGEKILLHDPTDYSKGGRKAWQYLPGQRRVRLAPSIGFDTPDFVVSGVLNFDEAFLFNGSPERYTWKLVGKKEMYVPYNDNRFLAAPGRTALGAHFVNPDLVRWELHRVWIVEGDLKSSARHVEPKRRLYLDEDTWAALLAESYAAVPELMTDAREASRRGEVGSAPFARALDRLAEPLLVRRLTRAVEFLGAFWTSAWEEAGRPLPN